MDFKNKTISFVGDSITFGYGLKNNETDRFSSIIERECKLEKAYNYGVSGTRIAYQSKPSERAAHDLYFCGRAFQLYPADLIFVYGGVNDYIHGDAPLGQPTDKTPTTFYGALEYLLTTLKENYPSSRLAFATPAHCVREGYTDSQPSSDARKGNDNSRHPLYVYVEAIKEKCLEHNVPVLDMFNDFEINVNNKAQREKYTTDGLHFNEAGHKLLAERIKKFLKTL